MADKLQQWWQPLAQVHSAGLQPDGGDWRQGLREAWMATPHESVRFQLGNPQPAVAAGPWEQAETRWVLCRSSLHTCCLPPVLAQGAICVMVWCQACDLSWQCHCCGKQEL